MPVLDRHVGKVIGCVQCLNKKDRYGETKGSVFDERDQQLAVSCANIVHVAIMAARASAASNKMVDLAVRQAGLQSAAARERQLEEA